MKEKKTKKKRISLFLTVDADIYEKFNTIIKEKFIDKSLLIDGLINEWLKNNELKS